MTKKHELQIFSEKRVRTVWDDEAEEWYFSVVDTVGVLTESENPRRYLSDLKRKLKKEGSEVYENIVQLKLPSPDGKMRMTDVATSEQLFRIIQSIPSPKAEPFKQWMAGVAATRIDQIQNPELSIDQAVADYKRQGYSDAWINQRLKSIEVRNELTAEWHTRGVMEKQYGILTDIITKEWSGFTTKEYKHHKGLKKQNLRDNMTNIELALNTLAEASTTELSKKQTPDTFQKNVSVAKGGGSVAKAARAELEKRLGSTVISKENASDYLLPKKADDE